MQDTSNSSSSALAGGLAAEVQEGEEELVEVVVRGVGGQQAAASPPSSSSLGPPPPEDAAWRAKLRQHEAHAEYMQQLAAQLAGAGEEEVAAQLVYQVGLVQEWPQAAHLLAAFGGGVGAGVTGVMCKHLAGGWRWWARGCACSCVLACLMCAHWRRYHGAAAHVIRARCAACCSLACAHLL